MKRIAVTIVSALVASAALAAQTPATSPTATPPNGASVAKPQSAPAAPQPKPSLSKDETVFAVLDPSGTVKSIIVSDWIHSDKPGIEIKDKSNLTSIENVKGYEQPRRVGDALMWKLDGSDLYYRGKSTQNLPLAINIRYWLDGKPVEAKALAGKTGTVKVRVEVKNLAAADRIIDGTKRRIYAPMIVVVGLTLPVVGYRDIQVTNGTILTDGQSNIAAGILVPGLKESIASAGSFGAQPIDLSGFGIKDLPLWDAFEFTAKAEKFKLGSIYILATPDFPEIGGPNTVKLLDDALGGFQQLADASKAIKDGSAALAQGTATLRASVTQALNFVKPFLSDAKPSVSALSEFLSDDRRIAAARELFSSAKNLEVVLPLLSDLMAKTNDPKTKQHLNAAVAYAKKINTKDLVGIPGAASIISEESLAAISDFLVSGDDLFKNMDEKRLQAAATFAVGSSALFDALVGYDEVLRAYDPAAGAALQAFGSKALELDAAAKKLAQKSAFDATKAQAALVERAAADTAFVGATAFLDDQSAVAALSAKLVSGASLTEAERASLAKLLQASGAERTAAKASQDALVADVLPSLAEGARLATQAASAAQAAASLSGKVLPGLALAQTNKGKVDATIAAGRKILDPQSTSIIASTVSKVFAMRKSYDKNRATISAARSFLSIRMKSGSFKSQVDLINSLQREMTALKPFMDSVQAAVASSEVVSLLGLGDPDAAGPSVMDLVADYQLLQPLLAVGKDALSSETLAKYKGILAKMPDVEGLLRQFDDGTALLAVKMGELAAGTKRFDEEGIQVLSGQFVDKAQLVRGFLKVKDELTALSQKYQSFSGAPDGADTTLKFIFKTDEIR